MLDNNRRAELSRAFARLSYLLDGNLFVTEALEAVGADSADPELGEAFRNVAGGVREGGSIADGMARFREILPAAVMELIRAGELTGDLARLTQLAADVLVPAAEASARIETECDRAFRALSRLMEGNLGLFNAMGGLAELLGREDLVEPCEDFVRRTKNGETLGAAATAVPQIFPEPIPALLQAADEAGNVDGVLREISRGLDNGCLTLPPFPGDSLAIEIRHVLFLASVGLTVRMNMTDLLGALAGCASRPALKGHVEEMQRNFADEAPEMIAGVMRKHSDVYPASMALFMEKAEAGRFEDGLRKTAEGIARGHFRLGDEA